MAVITEDKRETLIAKLALLFMSDEAACLQTLNHMKDAGHAIEGLTEFYNMAEAYVKLLPELNYFNPKTFRIIKDFL